MHTRHRKEVFNKKKTKKERTRHEGNEVALDRTCRIVLAGPICSHDLRPPFRLPAYRRRCRRGIIPPSGDYSRSFAAGSADQDPQAVVAWCVFPHSATVAFRQISP